MPGTGYPLVSISTTLAHPLLLFDASLHLDVDGSDSLGGDGLGG